MSENACRCCSKILPESSRRIYCNNYCKGKYYISQLPKRECHHCKVLFAPTRRDQSYCCVSCGLNATLTQRDIECIRCHKKFIHRGRGWRKYCKECKPIVARLRCYMHDVKTGVIKNPGVGSGGAQLGEANHQWKGDKRIREKYAHGYRETCYAVWEKQCAINVPQCTGRVVVHHIDGNKMNIALDNLIPLCDLHHRRTHASIVPTAEQLEQALLKIWPEGRIKIAEKIGEACQRVIRGEGQQQNADQPQRLENEPS